MNLREGSPDNFLLPENIINQLGGTIMFVDNGDGQRLYSVRDWVYWVSGSKSQQPHLPWAKLKRLLKQESLVDIEARQILEKVLQIPYPTLGGDQLMDFTDSDNLWLIKSRSVDYKVRRKSNRISAKRDEVENMHPEICNLLQENGWQTGTHVRLPSGKVIDIVANDGNRILVIECKLELDGNKFYAALGQAVAYAAEYGQFAYPAIAAPNEAITPYIEQICVYADVAVITYPDWDGF